MSRKHFHIATDGLRTGSTRKNMVTLGFRWLAASVNVTPVLEDVSYGTISDDVSEVLGYFVDFKLNYKDTEWRKRYYVKKSFVTIVIGKINAVKNSITNIFAKFLQKETTQIEVKYNGSNKD